MKSVLRLSLPTIIFFVSSSVGVTSSKSSYVPSTMKMIHPFSSSSSSSSSSTSSSSSACNITFYSGYDLNGGDLPNQPVSKTLSTPQQCADLCCSTTGCFAFSLNAPTGGPNTRACYLKSSSGWNNESISGVDSGSLPVPPPNTNFPWFNLSIPMDQRVNLLVQAMTIDEQISWLDNGAPSIPRLGIPAYDWEAEALHGVSWNGVSTIFPENIAWGATFDVPLVAQIGRVIAIEARAKWLAGLNSDGSSSEFAGLSFMTPNNNIFINPTWGRGQETYGEEPTLVAALTAAHVRALQFDDDGSFGNSSYHKIIAVSKHFLAYHLESYGNVGQYRLSHSFNVTETDIQQAYFVPFAAALNAGVSSVMCAYDGQNGTNPNWPNPDGPEPWGVPMCLHPIMDRLLRQQINWTGYVISDEGAITFAGPGYHQYTNNLVDAACLAMNAGTDLALGGEYGSTLKTCVTQGNVSAARVAQALTRTLTAQMQLGWFDTLAARSQNFPDPVPYNTVTLANNVSSPEHRAFANLVARESFILLKNNNGNTLPLLPNTVTNKNIALIGPALNYSGTATSSYIGSYSGCEAGPGGNLVSDPRCHVVTLFEALSNKAVSAGFTLTAAEGCDINTVNTNGFPAAVSAAANANIIIAAMGLDTCQESYCSEGEANDRGRGSNSVAPTLDLPGSQIPLLQTLVNTYPQTPIILVLFNGGPISSPYAYNISQAVLEVWYPGYEGGNAIVSTLFGEYSPAGRLPVTIVTDESEVPPVTDFILSTAPGRTSRYYTGTPLYPFGFGLSYTNFTYSQLSLQPSTLTPTDPSFTISAMVSSSAIGQISDEVVQVYGSFQGVSSGVASYPLQQLLNFTRVYSINPGSSHSVSFTIPRDALTLMSPGGTMEVATGQWIIYIGGGGPNNAKYPGGSAVLSTTLMVQ